MSRAFGLQVSLPTTTSLRGFGKIYFCRSRSLGVSKAATMMRAIAVFFVVLVFACLQAGAQQVNAVVKVDRNFEHRFTGFPLEGAHAAVPCETCHAGAVFKGVPTKCENCHEGGMASGKPENHPARGTACADCHNVTDWKSVHVDHGPIKTDCFSCHNNDAAAGKKKDHIKSTERCETCHQKSTWIVNKFNHNNTELPCATCHDRLRASGKPFNHVLSVDDCAACHVPLAWTVGAFDHTGTAAACFTCHDGRKATGKNATHLPTSNTCEDCHKSTVAWKPATGFDHTGVAGSCFSCHNGTKATGKTATHFVTSQACESCHTSTTTWTQIAAYTHLSLAYEPHGANATTCVDCHKQNTEKISFQWPAYVPDCASCHVNDFKPDSHKKFGDSKYTVSELRDCAGACHEYSDSTMTTIRTRRAGPEHRATRSEWN